MRKLVVVAALVAFAACKPQGGPGGSAAAPVKKNPGAAKLEFFVMSQCPYGVQVENAVKEVVDKLGPDLDFTLDFIGQVGANGELTSMHGPDEVTGNMVQLCAAKYAPAKYLDMILCQNKNMRQVATNWEACAKEQQLPVEQIKACLTGAEGKQLLTDSFKKAESKQARGSPTMFLNGKPFSPAKRSANAFLKGVCAEMTQKPAACANIPQAPAVNVTILSDKRCEKCAPERWEGMLRSRLENPVIKKLDYSDAEGKAFYESLGVADAQLPLVLFDASLDADKESLDMFNRHLTPMGTFRSLAVGGSWNPACANENGCKLPQCKESWTCRKEMPKRLDLFVMSQCPFGTRALDSMEEVLKNFENKIDFNVHFIGDVQGDEKEPKLSSMHGQDEVDEDLREICAIKHYAKNYKWMDYVLCRNKDIRSKEWQKCAVNGIDAKVIEKCFNGEGKKLLAESFKLAKAMGIGASPTWVVNNTTQFSASGAEAIKKNICDKNKDLKNCDKTLSGPPVPAAGQPQPSCGK